MDVWNRGTFHSPPYALICTKQKLDRLIGIAKSQMWNLGVDEAIGRIPNTLELDHRCFILIRRGLQEYFMTNIVDPFDCRWMGSLDEEMDSILVFWEVETRRYQKGGSQSI